MDYPYYGWHHKLPIMRAPDYHWRTEEQPEHASELPEQAPLDFSILFSPVAKWRRNLTFKLYRELHNQIGIQEATSLNFLSRLAKVADENSTLYKQFFIHSCANPHSATSRIGKDCLRIINGIESRIPIRQEFLDTIEQLSKNVDLETKMIAQYLLDKHPRPRSTFSASWLRNCVSREDLSEARMHLEELNITCQDCIKVCDVELLIQQDASTRRGQYNANRKRRVDNVSRMKDMIAWRDKEAKYLGFLNRAKFKANSQMGSCAICIEILIHDLRKTLVESATRRLHELLELKIKSLPRSGYARGLEKDVLYDWDYSFCKNLSTNGDGGNIVDWKKISEYLELNNTLKATLRVLGTLFGLKFREIRAGTPSTCISLYSRQKVWQQDVEIYSVWDKSRDQQTGFLGYLYLDLYSRPKKSMKPGHYCLQAATSYKRPSSVIFMNITKAEVKKPTLLQHDHLCSLFHYFGLAIHNLVSRAKYGRLFEYMEEDFNEIPGALLEQFCWETEILEDVGQHWAWISEDFGKLWRHSNAEMPSRTLSRETIEQLQTWKAINEGMEKLKECQYAMFDMGIYRPEPLTIHSSVLWNQQMTASVSPLTMEAMQEIEDDWEWGQCPARLETIRMRFMAGPTNLLINECARDVFETEFKNNLTDVHLGRRFIDTVLAGPSNSTGLYKLWDFLGRCPKPFDRMVTFSSKHDQGIGKEHHCHVYWTKRHQQELARSENPNLDLHQSKGSNHSLQSNPFIDGKHPVESSHSQESNHLEDPKNSDELHHPEEPKGSRSAATNALATPGTHTHPAANGYVTIRHPMLLGSNKLVKAPIGVVSGHRQGSSPVAEWYVYANDLMNRKVAKGASLAHVGIWFLIAILIDILSVPSQQPRSRLILILRILLRLIRLVFCITIEHLTEGSPTKSVEQYRSCTAAIVLEKVPTIRVGEVTFVVVTTASGERHMSVTDWMMWKDKDTKWLSDSRSENEEAPEGEEFISDYGIAREESEGQSSSSPKKKTSSSEPPLKTGIMSFGGCSRESWGLRGRFSWFCTFLPLLLEFGAWRSL